MEKLTKIMQKGDRLEFVAESPARLTIDTKEDGSIFCVDLLAGAKLTVTFGREAATSMTFCLTYLDDSF